MEPKKNQSLSKDELLSENERLIDELKKSKKYGLVWEQKPEDVVDMCKKRLPVLREVRKMAIKTNKVEPVNILIEGDNYHAVSVLNFTHNKKIDVIYIDPPFNTGAQDWKYNNDYVDKNDAYRHSKWLCMMSHRLKVAKKLLRNDGVLICAIDDNECAHLGVLLEEIFHGYEIHCITIVHNPRGVQGDNFSYTHEYAYFVFKKGLKVIGNRIIADKDISWRNLRDNGGESLRTDARNCFYGIIVKNGKIIGFTDVLNSDEHPEKQTMQINDKFVVYPIDSEGIERKWRYSLQSVEKIKNLLRTKKKSYGYEIQLGKNFGTVRTVWQDSKYDSNEYGTKLVNSLVPNCNFDFPKSVYNTFDCVAPILRSRNNAIILDFFAGSGTTGHAVMILNKEDNGKRRFILNTDNENGIAREVCYPRIKKVIEGHKDYPDITGIDSNLIYYQTDFVDAEPTDKNKIKLTEKATDLLCLKENTYELVLDKKDFKIYKNNKHYTGIIFDQLVIPDFKNAIKGIDKKLSVYIFSLSDETFEEEFSNLKQEVKLSPIPETILRTYRKIFK